MVVHNIYNNNRVFNHYCWITILKKHQNCWTIILIHLKTIVTLSVTAHYLYHQNNGRVHNIFFYQMRCRDNNIGGPQQQGILAVLWNNNDEKTSELFDYFPYAYKQLFKHQLSHSHESGTVISDYGTPVRPLFAKFSPLFFSYN